MLEARGYKTVCVIGSRSRVQRSKAVASFTNDPSVRVILLTTGSAAAGKTRMPCRQCLLVGVLALCSYFVDPCVGLWLSCVCCGLERSSNTNLIVVTLLLLLLLLMHPVLFLLVLRFLFSAFDRLVSSQCYNRENG